MRELIKEKKYTLSPVLIYKIYTVLSMVLEDLVFQMLMYVENFSCMIMLMVKIIHLGASFVS